MKGKFSVGSRELGSSARYAFVIFWFLSVEMFVIPKFSAQIGQKEQRLSKTTQK